MRNKIKTEVDRVLKDLDQKPVKYQVEHPADMAHGDYSVNVALVTGGGRKLAEKIVGNHKAHSQEFRASFCSASCRS